ncbi:deoxynucleoside triphosphate triphosphohydrolase SAMHD1-like [Megalobrama amblycephala]|uniref:deoxynucleoside triphosphate triphosphohydrolase SAMHD1-like n=1 Tax=Megalobrama amblycephala TaxID=75352 RepID=UPI0020142098|nr:deoxynucleoside triphosphate triphosphohydrolase SAMHD1-like [Megalobrama amblycephala]
MKIFNDPIHGQIELHPLLVKIIDTPQFQRLRHLKQLGSKFLVYPGATHTRFEHSIGVAYLAGCLLKSLRDNQPELNITKQDALCVQIAGLCHDLGHGPFSHLFDGMFIPEVRPNDKWEHEDASVKMFHYMRSKNGLDKVMKEYDLNLDDDIPFTEELIKGNRTSRLLKLKIFFFLQRPPNKSFLYEIVANKLNGIDVDKWDYLARDCHYLGIPNSFDHQRLLKSARVCEVDGEKQICFRDKVADNIHGMFHTRYTLHRQALQHKIGFIIDVKIKDALVLADRKLVPGCKISDAIHDMSEYTKLTDHIYDQILLDSNPELVEAQDILNDIINRQLPKFVGEARLNEDLLEEKLLEQWQQMVDKYNTFYNQDLEAEDFDIHVLDMGFGEVGNEPIDNVHFYSKSNLNTAFKIEKYQKKKRKPEEMEKMEEELEEMEKEETGKMEEEVEEMEKEETGKMEEELEEMEKEETGKMEEEVEEMKKEETDKMEEEVKEMEKRETEEMKKMEKEEKEKIEEEEMEKMEEEVEEMEKEEMWKMEEEVEEMEEMEKEEMEKIEEEEMKEM